MIISRTESELLLLHDENCLMYPEILYTTSSSYEPDLGSYEPVFENCVLNRTNPITYYCMCYKISSIKLKKIESN